MPTPGDAAGKDKDLPTAQEAAIERQEGKETELLEKWGGLTEEQITSMPTDVRNRFLKNFTTLDSTADPTEKERYAQERRLAREVGELAAKLRLRDRELQINAPDGSTVSVRLEDFANFGVVCAERSALAKKGATVDDVRAAIWESMSPAAEKKAR